MSRVKEFFRQSFGFLPNQVVQAPGRLELLGNHTDYNGGLVMSIAVDRYIAMACSPRNDGRIELVSSAFPQRDRCYFDQIKKNPDAPWADYIKGVLLQLKRQNVHFTGFNAAIHGTIPLGAGLSSSAALEVATALAIRELFPYTLTETGVHSRPDRGQGGRLPALKPREKMLLARLCQRAESEFVGVKCGLLDQISSLFGREAHVIGIDCRHHTVEHFPMVGGVAVVVCESGVRHQLNGGEYNELRQQCEWAAQKLGVRALRSATFEMLEAARHKLTPREFECAFHIVGENHRVATGEQALRAGDVSQFGQFLYQSHESSRDCFGNSTRELDLLVDLARQHPACLGARLTGGGFGGATINLVDYHRVRDFMEFMARQYEEKSGVKLNPMICQVVDGAR